MKVLVFLKRVPDTATRVRIAASFAGSFSYTARIMGSASAGCFSMVSRGNRW